MRYIHRDIPRLFEVPLGSWFILTIGSLLCILLIKDIPSVAGYRFLVWTGLGQIIYFSYGFWHSKQRKLRKITSIATALELLPTVANVTEQYTQNGLESESANGNTESAV
ncbi:unnamed protein product [Rotaria sordida]|uniref:Cationic amino acid transporter C-terminal domain-containing protein n=2 Tax=Rotaria sordida TaxID=392033 RepID=A0A819IUX6_9BILA|nr:unnamed protein product [Rotaria sordida]CAF3923205.1 unnamed protein product [Rotaria sordida]